MTDLSPLFAWRAALVASSLPPTCRHVALTLSLHMNDQGGSCFPSVDLLADETGLSRRAVQQNLTKLTATGWLQLQRGGGRGRSNRYVSAVPSPTETAQDVHPIGRETGQEIHGNRNAESDTAFLTLERVHLTTGKGAAGAPEDVNNSSEDDTRGSAARRNGRASSTDPTGFTDCWAAYPRKLNRKGAAKAYAARLKDGTDPADLLTATKAYAKACAGKQPEFVMHGSTFFGPNDRWKDYLRPESPPPPASGIGAAASLPNGGCLTVVPNSPAEWEAMGFKVGTAS